MAKHNCAICGVEVNLLQQQKLADGNYVCRKVCAKKVMKDFDLVHATLYDVQAHIKQVEEGSRIYEKLFVPNKKKIVRPSAGGMVHVLEDFGLMAKIENRYKTFIFGKYTLACVYRIADLYGYEYEEDTKVSMGNAAAGQKTNTTQKVRYVHYYFWDTQGMSDFLSPLDNTNYEKLCKYYNTLFGIQKTIGNIGNTWKNQLNAIKSVGSAIKVAASDRDNLEAKAGDAAAAMDRMQYGDRTEWIAKADAALRSV